MNIRKVVSIITVFCLCMTIFVQYPIFAEEEQDVNPFSITATDLDSDGKFTVNINISKDCLIEAFKVSVIYDASLISICEGENQYANYFSFLEKYNGNNKGICLNNHLLDESKFIFAGAQPSESEAALAKGDRVAFINFQLKSENLDKTIEDVLPQIKFSVENCTDGNEDIVKKYPQEFSIPMVPVGGDDLRGDAFILGDVNFDGKVNITDVTIVLRAALGMVTLDYRESFAADVDSNGKINITDTVKTLHLALNIV